MSKQKRLKKIIKAKLNRVLVTGVPSLATPSLQESRLVELDSIAKAGGDGAGEGSGDGLLLDVIGIANPGLINETLNIDEDGAAHGVDFDDLDASEVRDTDNDGIGDNRDIVFNKIALDAFLRSIGADGNPVAPNDGSIADIATRFANARTDLEAAAGLADPADQATRLAQLRAGTAVGQVAQAADCTKAALATLLTTLQDQQSQANELKAEIAAATATAGVTVPGANPYHLSGASVIAVTGANDVDVDAAVAAATANKNLCDAALDTIEP